MHLLRKIIATLAVPDEPKILPLIRNGKGGYDLIQRIEMDQIK